MSHKKSGERRYEPADSLDYFPTPPWATRALFKYVLFKQYNDTPLSEMSALEPACGAGHTAEVLKKHFRAVIASDIADYGYPCIKADYLEHPFSTHWMITNPPFNRAEEFVLKGLQESTVGVALFARLAFLETKGRFNNIYSHSPPSKVAVFSERVPLVKGKLDPSASSSAAYCWLVWELEHQSNTTELLWIPPCRADLEQDSDYSS